VYCSNIKCESGVDAAATGVGDLLAVFAQYGEIVDVNLVRDQDTGKSKGFAFLAYEDQVRRRGRLLTEAPACCVSVSRE
jgi:hypothetical protein